jgi:hypothetical protein
MPDLTPDPDPTAYLEAHAAFEQQVTDYLTKVDSIAGPLGVLLRAVGHAYGGFLADDQDGHATAAEYARIAGVMEAAMDCRTWLQEAS